MKKRYNMFLIVCIIPLILTGCWDYVDVNRRSITLSVGVDHAKDGKGIEYTGEIAKLTPSKGGKQENSGSSGSVTLTNVYDYMSDGENFEDARANFDRKIPRKDFSGAARTVVFSRSYAENPGIESYVNRVNNLFGYRSALMISVSEIPTRQLFSTDIKNDISVGHAIEDTLRHLYEEGSIVYKTAYEANSDILLKEVGYAIPYIGVRNDSISVIGYAIMGENSKLIDVVKLEEADGLNFIISKNPVTQMLFDHPMHPKDKISIKTSLKKRKIRTGYSDDSININIDLNLKSEIQYPYYFVKLNDNDIKELEKAIENKMKKDILRLIKQSQEKFEIDYFDFARYFRAQNPEIYRKISWKKEYPNIKFTVNVKTKIVNTNMLDIYKQ